MEIDFAVVGSGSAGAVLAARLSEDSARTVALLEAGPPGRSPLLHLPAAARYAFNAPRYNWRYLSEPEHELNGRRIPQPRGRVLGGSSSINGLVYLRGHALDYERWADAGATGWSYADVLPYFLRLEGWDRARDGYQGDAGPVQVSVAESLNPISQAFLNACEQAGYAMSTDVNGYRQEGAGRFPMNVAGGWRYGTARAYLAPARERTNLQILTHCHVDRLVVRNQRVLGVRYRRHGKAHTLRVRREVILSAGAFNSPKILMLSGIGDAETLARHEIPIVHELPGVGRNLQDHGLISVQLACRQPVSLAGQLGPLARARSLARWLTHRDGLLASNHFEAGAFIRSAAGVEFPDLQLYLFPIGVAEGSHAFSRDHRFQVQISNQRSESRGEVDLRSDDPDAPPRIRFNYLSSERDLVELRAGLRLTREILSQPAMASMLERELQPGPDIQTDDELDAFIREHLTSSYHPCGTCRMGSDDDAVVDPQCRVRGVENLRVADASIMPLIPSCNINCPTMMIGEKVADMIAGREAPAPSNLPYFVDSEWRSRQRGG